MVQKKDCILFTFYQLWLIILIICCFKPPSFTIIILKLYDQASKDDDGTVRIQRPLKGPFYVSGKTIDENIANFVDYARLLYFIVGFVSFGLQEFFID